ncbi:MAG: hypothetical protein KBD37_00380 [Burkholderiales bacterium]|nr:hypothetical protein [Burkholderiales bacterium]
MNKPIWITIGTLENYEKSDSLQKLMKKFINFCRLSGSKRGSIINIEEFFQLNKIGPTQQKMLMGILELRTYLKKNKLIHDVDVIEDNVKFRLNSIAYMLGKYLNSEDDEEVEAC